MRKLLCTAVILGLSGLLVGCPGGGGKTKTGAKTGAAKTGDAKTGDAKTGEGDAKTGDGEAAKTEEPKVEAPKGADISHVKVGQVYVYKSVTDMGGNKSESTMKYKVLEIKDGKIKYQTIVVAAGNEMPGGEAWWGEAAPAASPTGDAPKADVKMTEESVEAGGQKWDCKVMETEASGSKSKSWVPYKNGVPTWPMYIKSESENPAMKMTTTSTLESIEG
ncbi:MAG: hypothetical protein AB7N76_11140 [Planctomycetota bacterium]